MEVRAITSTALQADAQTGAANFARDETPYTDGEITREGPVGTQGDGPYSAGRGGVGNIDKDGVAQPKVGDEDIVPETAIRESKNEPMHFGRGGAGNEVKKKQQTAEQHGFEKKVPHDSLKDKVKEVFTKH